MNLRNLFLWWQPDLISQEREWNGLNVGRDWLEAAEVYGLCKEAWWSARLQSTQAKAQTVEGPWEALGGGVTGPSRLPTVHAHPTAAIQERSGGDH